MTTAHAAVIAAVRQYLNEAFLGWSVEDFTAMPERQAHHFQVRRESMLHAATLSFEFLTGTPPADIPRRLRQWRLAEEMRPVRVACW